mmetsp:Transcript_135326/g.270004  ORF Transcript_135326/g.270004 Transcript_135326/m.270004 type:complete len:213 (+) Transcript_135326:1728-2366(+)
MIFAGPLGSCATSWCLCPDLHTRRLPQCLPCNRKMVASRGHQRPQGSLADRVQKHIAIRYLPPGHQARRHRAAFAPRYGASVFVGAFASSKPHVGQADPLCQPGILARRLAANCAVAAANLSQGGHSASQCGQQSGCHRLAWHRFASLFSLAMPLGNSVVGCRVAAPAMQKVPSQGAHDHQYLGCVVRTMERTQESGHLVPPAVPGSDPAGS